MSIAIKASHLFNAVENLRKQQPLVHNITNYVVMQTSANILLAAGASPIMAHEPMELADIVSMANALVLNIGTLSKGWLDSFQQAQQLANAKKIPIILDPVGAGASRLRTLTARKILADGVSIVRGNASEIAALLSDSVQTKGVDSLNKTDDVIDAALSLAKQYYCCVVVSGAVDIVCYQGHIVFLNNGSPLLTKVTGMGCSATALIAAFAAVESNLMLASSYAISMLNIAAEYAENTSVGPGSFATQLIDQLYNFSQQNCQCVQVKEQAHA